MSFLHENWTRMVALNQRKRKREKDREGRESGYDLFMKTTRFNYFLRSIFFCASLFSSWSCLNHACCSIGPYLSAPKRIFKNDEFWPTSGPCEKSGQVTSLGAKISRGGARWAREIFSEIFFSWINAGSFVEFLTGFLPGVFKKCQPIRLHNHLRLGGHVIWPDSIWIITRFFCFGRKMPHDAEKILKPLKKRCLKGNAT